MRYKPFYGKVDIRKPKDMIEYLKGHFRYHTMNSWNRSTSYANNLKIHKVIPGELQDVAYEIMNQGDVYNEINALLSDFAVEHEYEYQAGFNGRSGGYLVLIRGGYKMKRYFSDFSPDAPDDKRDYSDYYGGWYSHKEAKEMGTAYSSYKQVYTQPGKDIDMCAEYEDWDVEELRNRVKLVREFDRLCNDVVNLFVEYCRRYEVKEEEIQVPKTVKVLVEK
ncbi:hypothetical protein KY345_06045 [Candidatus Woesearchaeota archaeon]|nr:hypothetical protein [Candidatus Woesearchaeota archaeon]